MWDIILVKSRPSRDLTKNYVLLLFVCLASRLPNVTRDFHEKGQPGHMTPALPICRRVNVKTVFPGHFCDKPLNRYDWKTTSRERRKLRATIERSFEILLPIPIFFIAKFWFCEYLPFSHHRPLTCVMLLSNVYKNASSFIYPLHLRDTNAPGLHLYIFFFCLLQTYR